MSFNWHILSQHHGGCTRLLDDPAGGLTLQHLVAEGSRGQTFVLDVEAGQALRARYTSAPTLEAALALLVQHGYGVVPPPATDPTALEPTLATEPCSPGEVMPENPHGRPLTVLEHCLVVESQLQGVAVPVEIRHHLLGWRIPLDSPYEDWAEELARVSMGRYPVTDVA